MRGSQVDGKDRVTAESAHHAEDLGVGDLVVVHCQSPRDKLWGVLLRLDQVGVVVRGLDLNSVEDWLRQEAGGSEALMGPSTVFVPLHRVERIYLEETDGAVAGFADRYRETCGRDVRDALVDRRPDRDGQ